MKKLIYKVEGYSSVFNPETEKVEQQLSLAEVTVENPTDKDIARAQACAWNGEYTIEESYPNAPRNITAGEYITVNGILYKATSNIPNGEPIITGQNAVETTIEE
jgi:hypothetical protein